MTVDPPNPLGSPPKPRKSISQVPPSPPAPFLSSPLPRCGCDRLASPGAYRAWGGEQIRKMKKKDLVAYAEECGFDSTGTNKAIIERILADQL